MKYAQSRQNGELRSKAGFHMITTLIAGKKQNNNKKKQTKNRRSLRSDRWKQLLSECDDRIDHSNCCDNDMAEIDFSSCLRFISLR